MGISRGLVVLGTDTDVGKTYVACRILESLVAKGVAAGAYKPVVSGIVDPEQSDSTLLWNASGRRGSVSMVTPQSFAAPLAPPIAAELESKSVDDAMLLDGLVAWQGQCDFLVVEGAGGLLSPISWAMTNADLASQSGLPIVLVAQNRLGVVNQVLTTLSAATAMGLGVRAIVLNHTADLSNREQSVSSNERLLEAFLPEANRPKLITLEFGAKDFKPKIDWQTIGTVVD